MNLNEQETQPQLESTSRRFWSPEDVAYLRGNASVGNCHQIAKTLNRTIRAVQQKAYMLGIPPLGISPEAPEQHRARFWGKVNKTDTCWLWTGWVARGYGVFDLHGVSGGSITAHRMAYALVMGDVPDGLELHHKCKVRACVNPDHLEPLTKPEHAKRHSKTHCKRGHAFDARNTYFATKGTRACKKCHTDQQQVWLKNRRNTGACNVGSQPI